MLMTPKSSIGISPDEVDAGSEMTLRGRLALSPARDAAGWKIQIIDHTSVPAGETTFASFDGETYEILPLVLCAPDEPGRYEWRVVPIAWNDAPGPDPVLLEDNATFFSVQVRAHRTWLMVWGVPSAVEPGAAFRMSVGAKCSSGCDMAGRAFEVLDMEGVVLAHGAFAGLRAGTESLHEATIDLVAADVAGLSRWSVRMAGWGSVHDAATAEFNVRTTSSAECNVTILAIAEETGQPLAFQSIVAHPYRAMTNVDGVATLRVPKGEYTIYVSGRGRYPIQRHFEVRGDITTKAVLQAEPPPSGNW